MALPLPPVFVFRPASELDFPALVEFVHQLHVDSSSWDAASHAAQTADLATDFPDLVSPSAFSSLSRGAWLVCIGPGGPAAAAAGLDGGPEGTVVGAAGLKVCPSLPLPALDVSYLFVAPQWRGRGLGALLLRTCLQHAAGAGAPTVRLLSITQYAAALSLYAGFGFFEYRERETVGLYTLVHLEKRLNAADAAVAAPAAGEK
jgi:GNAT superfamily N-acetyltransferase